MTDLDKPVAQLLETYRTAVATKNITTFMRLYDPQVRVFDAWGVWSYEGASAWQQAVEGWFTSMGSDKVAVSFDDLQTTATREIAVISAVVTYASVSAQGEPQRSMQNRITWALKLSAHVWRIVHEHTSAPLDFNNHTGILQRGAVR